MNQDVITGALFLRLLYRARFQNDCICLDKLVHELLISGAYLVVR